MDGGCAVTELVSTEILVISYEGSGGVLNDEYLILMDGVLVPPSILRIIDFYKKMICLLIQEKYSGLNVSLKDDSLIPIIDPVVDAAARFRKIVFRIIGSDVTSDLVHEFRKYSKHITSSILVGDIFSSSEFDSSHGKDNSDIDGSIISSSESMINEFLRANERREISGKFSIGFDLKDNQYGFSGYQLRDPNRQYFEPADVSGLGVLDGYQMSKKIIWIKPIVNDVSSNILKFLVTDESIFQTLLSSNLLNKVLGYTAVQKLDVTGKTQYYISGLTVENVEVCNYGSLL